MTEEPSLVGLPEAAERLGVHYMTAYRYVRTGRLPGVKVGGQWAVEADALVTFLAGGVPDEAPTARRVTGRAAAARLEARLLAGDRAGAWAVAEEALAAGAGLGEVEVDLVARAMRSIGERWEAGELRVGDEHQATVVAQHVLATLGARFGRRGRRGATVVIGAAPGDEHQIPVTITADHLRVAGFEVVDFGADTPPEAFAEAAREASPVAVVVGATGPGRHAAVRRVVRAVRTAAPDIPVLVGGAAIPDAATARKLGADGWTGPDAPAVVRAVQRLQTVPDEDPRPTDRSAP